MVKYQGEDIEFVLELTPPGGNTSAAASFDEFSNVVLYFYTSNSRICKFSRDTKADYNKLTVSNGKLTGKIPSLSTKGMQGMLTVDVLCSRLVTGGDLQDDLIQAAVSTGIVISTSRIKNEI